MAEPIVNEQKLDPLILQNELLSAIAQIRMMKAYVERHIDSSTTDGPNEGDAGPDLIFQCNSIIRSLDKLLVY